MTSIAPIPAPAASPAGANQRILIGADTFPPDINGAAQFASRLARGLAGRGHDVHVLCPSTRRRSTVEQVDGVTVHRLGSIGTPAHPTFRLCTPWQANRAAATLLDQLKPDVVHVQAHFLIGRGLIRAAHRRGIPVIATNHFMPENLYGHLRVPAVLQKTANRLAWQDLRRVYTRVQAVTAPTPRAVELLAANGIPDATAVSCGVDLSRFDGDDIATPVPHVLFVGRLDEEKRVDELLRAAHVVAKDEDFRLEIVGDGQCRSDWQQLAGRLGLAGRVTWHGFVSEQAVTEAYLRADVFCMPGIAELQSLATMDALAAGRPVIAADAMALPHLVRPGETGWLYRPGDVAELAGHLRALLTDSATRVRMGEAGRQLIATHSAGTTIGAFEALYRTLCPVS